MASTSTKASRTSKPKSQAKGSQAKSAPAPSRVEQARAAAESAVDVPVGAVLEVSDRVAELVDPFTGRKAAQKQLKSYGTQLRRSVKRSERRGAKVRRKAATEARKAIERRTSRAQGLVDQVGEQLSALRA
jgi:hypothetical protein